MLASALSALLIRALTADVVAAILLRLARYLASRTETAVDDDIVAILEKAINGSAK